MPTVMQVGPAPYGGAAYGGGGPVITYAVDASITAVPDAAAGVVRITADWEDADYYRIVRVVGTTATPVRGAYPIAAVPAGATVSIVDGEAPLDTLFYYELSTPSDTSFVVRTPQMILPGTPAGGGSATWLSHPAHPGEPMKVKVTAAPTLTRTTRRGLFPVMGRAEPIAVASSVRSSPEGTITVLTETFAERDQLLDMLADNQPLLLRPPAELGYGSGWWISVGDITESAQTHYAGENADGEAVRLHELPFVVVSAPIAVAA